MTATSSSSAAYHGRPSHVNPAVLAAAAGDTTAYRVGATGYNSAQPHANTNANAPNRPAYQHNGSAGAAAGRGQPPRYNGNNSNNNRDAAGPREAGGRRY
jgi:hypothetical protein